MHFDGKMKNNRRKIERGLGILPYGNSTTQTIGKCGGFRLCHDTGSACYDCQELLRTLVIPTFSLSRPLSEKLINRLFFLVKVGITFSPCVSFQHYPK